MARDTDWTQGIGSGTRREKIVRTNPPATKKDDKKTDSTKSK